jgi:hypothetical protein
VGEAVYNSNRGRVQVYEGSHFTSGSGDVTPDATIDSPVGGSPPWQFGFAVSVGRLNGDAYADVLIGAPQKTTDGRAYIYLGNSDGTGLTSGASPAITLQGLSQSGGERFGNSVHIADWAGDGTADAIVGANLANAGGTRRGSVYWFDDPLIDQTIDEAASGGQSDERFGQCLASGKFSNDPRLVVAIGAYLWDDASPSEADAGRVVVANVPEPLGVMAVAILGLPPLGRRLRARRKGVVPPH